MIIRPSGKVLPKGVCLSHQGRIFIGVTQHSSESSKKKPGGEDDRIQTIEFSKRTLLFPYPDRQEYLPVFSENYELLSVFDGFAKS